jgi:molecular chaperone GrpE (heat shock protein)
VEMMENLKQDMNQDVTNTEINESESSETLTGQADEITNDEPVNELPSNQDTLNIKNVKPFDQTSAETHEHYISTQNLLVQFEALVENQKTLCNQANQMKDNLENVNSLQKKLNDNIYSDLQDYKDKFINSLYTPLLKDLLRLYDSIVDNSKYIAQDDAKDKLHFIAEQLLSILSTYDVEPMPMEPNMLYDMKKHKALKREDTDDEFKHKTVKEVLRRGFYVRDIILRPQEVSVYFCTKPIAVAK